jgi:hypothetical protein
VRLREVLTPIFVTAYDIERRAAFFFRSERARRDPGHDFGLVDVAHAHLRGADLLRARARARGRRRRPLRAHRRRRLRDEPAMCAFAEVTGTGAIDVVASLGTGELTRPIRTTRAGLGQLQWARPVLDVVFDGVADTVDFELARLVPGSGYVRLQTELRTASDRLDDAGAKNLGGCAARPRQLIAARDAELDALCARLTG